MKGKGEMAASIALTALSLMIGLGGIAVLIGVGEGADNAIVAFAAVSVPFAVLAGLFSWITPQARWPIAAAMCGPVTLLGIAGAWSGSVMLIGAVCTAAATCAGAYAGARLKLPGTRGEGPPA